MSQQARASDLDLEELGKAMLSRKEELKAQAEAGGLPPAQLETMRI